MNIIAVINIAKVQLGMEEADYRAMLAQVTGKTSLRAMTPVEHKLVLDRMKALGFRVKVGAKRLPKVARPQIRRLYALWYSCHRYGVIANRSNAALRAFCGRVLAPGQDGVVFDPDLLSPPQASKVIEVLKAMEERGQRAAG
ncbi:MAG: GemA protein [Tistrella sp.]|uniref:regulatory protein GemA n=1 Tax=Tistrella sp. TaxID=2024861 RepID=UPI000C62CCAF|nr:regulatory protein GemA [Tistrella sp.]MAD39557.1 GemA protein [Tistrella sp.]MBA74902.1 GemA protein [Tistrella sp.]|tara:strand:- start:55 stop:480 length:426 start_codon:yes stop_codon:yes gene_type:complete